MSGDEKGENPRRAIFNALAPTWDAKGAPDGERARTIAAAIEALGLVPGAAILDVGCGTGVLVPFLLPYLGEGGRYLGIDVSDGMIAIARSKYRDPRVGFEVRDLYDLGPSAPGYDLVIAFSSFPHLHDKRGALSIFAALLKPRGRLCVLHVESSRAINEFHRERTASEVLRRDRLPSLDELRELIDPSLWKPLAGEDREGLYLVELERR